MVKVIWANRYNKVRKIIRFLPPKNWVQCFLKYCVSRCSDSFKTHCLLAGRKLVSVHHEQLTIGAVVCCDSEE